MFFLLYCSKNDYQQKEYVLLAKLKEEFLENFNGELEGNKVKIIGCHVPQAPVPELLARFVLAFCTVSQNTAVQKGVQVFCNS